MTTAGEHRRAAEGRGPIPIALVTVSDSRTEETDVNGRWLRERVAAAGHEPRLYRLVPDEPERVLDALEAAVDADARVVVFNGGTGIAARDRTYDALAGRFERTLPGFGELFRMLSWRQVGSAAMLSRAVAGIHRGAVVFSVPGSPAAVTLAWERLIEPELEHLAWELVR